MSTIGRHGVYLPTINVDGHIWQSNIRSYDLDLTRNDIAISELWMTYVLQLDEFTLCADVIKYDKHDTVSYQVQRFTLARNGMMIQIAQVEYQDPFVLEQCLAHAYSWFLSVTGANYESK